ncbi:hypothetical protein ABQG71_06355 [Bacillus altitudinis]|uniref:Uncharacterized protein n=1 Tax=Bacillus altitudinis TaxID=293387 RepID=A0ABV1S2Q0_BACAB
MQSLVTTVTPGNRYMTTKMMRELITKTASVGNRPTESTPTFAWFSKNIKQNRTELEAVADS